MPSQKFFLNNIYFTINSVGNNIVVSLTFIKIISLWYVILISSCLLFWQKNGERLLHQF